MTSNPQDPSTWERQLVIGLVLKAKATRTEAEAIHAKVCLALSGIEGLRVSAESVYWNDEKIVDRG